MNTNIAGAPRRDAQWFYVWMAGVFVLIAFGGFTPTYWSKIAAGTFKGAPVLHIHGMLFFAWTLLFLTQTVFVATGRTPNHRNWGMAGIALATAMGFTIVLGAINSIKVASAMGMGDDARRFTIVSLSGLLLFWGFFAAAIANIRNADLHKRLMLLANIPLMHAAMARLFMTAFAPPDAKGPPPIFVAIPPGIAVDLLVVAAIVHDWRRRGRPHAVYLVGLAILLAVQLTLVPVGKSDAWMSIAKWVESLAG